jgi:REP element-mobilizing transposase RayT
MAKQLKLGFFEPAKRRKPGRRVAAARRPKRVRHRPRPWHDANHPVHVTLRVQEGVSCLRSRAVAAAIVAWFRARAWSTTARDLERARRFRVIHFSIQPNHLHLIVEASSKRALSTGMQGLASGLARRINRTLRRQGSLFADRYHAHALRSPREVRHSIVYVLKNFEKHPVPFPDLDTVPEHGIDPCSSARWFAGWSQAPPPPVRPAPISAPSTWLLRLGWRQRGGGPIARHERPSAVS